MAQCFLQSDAGESITLTAHPISLGRHPDNDVVVRDDLASRFHCVIEPIDGASYRVKDLGSRNGTRVNSQNIDTLDLSSGDTIAIGSHEFTYLVDSQPDNTRARTQAPPSSLGNEPWVHKLYAMISDRSSVPLADSSISMIDAHNDPTDTLSGDTIGPAALRLLLMLSGTTRATDLHLEPRRDDYQLRIRVDGQMISVCDLPKRVGDLVSGVVRTACQVKVAARDTIQEGHFSARINNARVDYRVSFTPSLEGQKTVIRVLDLRYTPDSIDQLGFTPYMIDRIRKVCLKDAGMVLVCGPTGSGKTTTIYSAMRDIDRDTRNVITIEDPVEYHLEGVTQMPIDEARGNSFSSLLRSILRQDPDVIFVGEIRDEDTARTTMRAALTGHLVFSTIHAKNTIGSMFRLLDLGVEPQLVANSLDLIIAQRLVRVLCDRCKQSTPMTPSISQRMGTVGQGVTEMFTPVGCSRCLRTGYRGRRAIMEMLELNDEMREIITNNPTVSALKAALEGELFTSLEKAGWHLVAQGSTSVDEVERVMGS
ncbi:MAG: ATPase, T2SS/T4P/T4SS family [Planctomycetota bacterium]|jgi:general secretion pathway protein E